MMNPAPDLMNIYYQVALRPGFPPFEILLSLRLCLQKPPEKHSQSWQGQSCAELEGLGEVAPGSPQKPSFHFSAWQIEAQRGRGTVRSRCRWAPLAPLSAQTVGSHSQQPGWGQEGGDRKVGTTLGEVGRKPGGR